ncbi:MAG: glycosyltransferase [Pirellulales bacterium]|nr:glycosyltransferase [Pirellulales bacterium]
MLEVAWLFEYPTLNGGEYSLLATFEGLRAAGFYIRAIAPAHGPLSAALAARRVDLIPLEEAGTPDNGTPPTSEPLPMRRQLAAILKKLKPALLHANSLKMGRISGPVVAQMNLPSVAHLRDILRLSQGSIDDLNQHRRLLAVSHATRDYHVAQGIAAEKTHVMYNGVDLARFRPHAPDGWLRRELDLPREALLVGNIGQLVQRKGLDVLAQAAGMLAKSHLRLHYLIIGERYSRKPEALAYEQQVRQTFHNLGLQQRVHFLGVRHDVDLILPELDLLVHAARQEPLGRVLLEAAACGTAIVATDVGGTREIFPSHEPAAMLVPPDRPERLAAAMATLAGDAALRCELGAAARRRAVEAFDAQAAAETLAGYYRAVLGGNVAHTAR